MKRTIMYICFAFLIGTISAKLKARIIGGNDANIQDFPYQASLRVRGEHFCGATIISDKHILTAAHCFTHNRNKGVVAPYVDVSVNAGYSSTAESGHSYRITKVTIHPDWTREAFSTNDIAVITLSDRIRFDASQQKAELPSHDVVSGTKAYLTGWGRTSQQENARSAIQLQKLQMTLLDFADCDLQMPVRIQENEICAYHSKGHGCNMGDSGGPLAVGNQVVGVLSWIYNSICASGIPEVYTNVYAHKNFIESTMNEGLNP